MAETGVPSSPSRPAGGTTGALQPMIVTTTESIREARVTKTLGQVFGLTVRSRSLRGNIVAHLKSLVGGEIRSYVKLNEDARRQAIDRMVHCHQTSPPREGERTVMGVLGWVIVAAVVVGAVAVWYDPTTGGREYRPD